MSAPVIIGFRCRGVFHILQNALEYIDKVSVTGVLYGFYEIQGCFMKVASGVNISNVKTIVAMVLGSCGDYLLLETNQGHNSLKG